MKNESNRSKATTFNARDYLRDRKQVRIEYAEQMLWERNERYNAAMDNATVITDDPTDEQMGLT